MIKSLAGVSMRIIIIMAVISLVGCSLGGEESYKESNPIHPTTIEEAASSVVEPLPPMMPVEMPVGDAPEEEVDFDPTEALIDPSPPFWRDNNLVPRFLIPRKTLPHKVWVIILLEGEYLTTANNGALAVFCDAEGMVIITYDGGLIDCTGDKDDIEFGSARADVCGAPFYVQFKQWPDFLGGPDGDPWIEAKSFGSVDVCDNPVD